MPSPTPEGEWYAEYFNNRDQIPPPVVTRREYERALKVPPTLVGEMKEHSAKGYQGWTEARPANDFSMVRDDLERMLDLSRKLADFFPATNTSPIR